MRYPITILLLFFVLPFLSGQCRELVWSDEFETAGAPNPANWTYDLGTGSGGWGNNEIQVYTDKSENVRVADGSLIIDAVKNGNSWTSARVKSQGLQSFQYGTIEFRAKLPEGSGTWPALWMLGEDITTVSWPACGEIDIMEHVGKDPGKIHGSLHSPSSFGATVNTGTITIDDFATNFHTYSAEWTPERITFYVDGVAYYSYGPASKNDANWPFEDDFFLIMNIAMGGNFGSDPQYESNGLRNGVDPNLRSARMEVDYVRVYKDNVSLSMSGETLLSAGEEEAVFSVQGIADAVYEWSVPEGATITSGQGTPDIEVTWGSTDGSVRVEVTGNCGTYIASRFVELSNTPQGDSYLIDDFEDADFSRWKTEAGEGNTFQLEETGGALKVAYDVSSPARNPRLVLELDGTVDLSTYTEMEVIARTTNQSGTVSMRCDLFDAQGNTTTQTPVFRLEPVNASGENTTYIFDFADNWGNVDPTAIKGLYFYINYGFFGRPGQDSVWLESMQMLNPNRVTDVETKLKETIGLKLYPNPVEQVLFLQNKKEEATAELYTSSGQLVRRFALAHGSQQLDCTSFPAGVYHLKVLYRDFQEVHRLVIR